MHANLDYNYPVLFYVTVLFAMQSFIRLVPELDLHGLACHPRPDGAYLSFMLIFRSYFSEIFRSFTYGADIDMHTPVFIYAEINPRKIVLMCIVSCRTVGIGISIADVYVKNGGYDTE